MKSAQVILIGIVVIALLLVGIAFNPLVIVNAGERGVITQFGAVQEKVLGEGLHWILPVRDQVHILSVQVQKHQVPAAASTKDLQDLHAEIAVNFYLQPQEIQHTYQRQGNLANIVDKIIAPQAQESFKTAAAAYTAEESVTRRTELKERFDQVLSQRLSNYGVAVLDTSVVDIKFSEEFATAVEAKQVAEQNAQRAAYVAVQAANEAQATVNRAKGEADAQALLIKTLTPEILTKQALDNQRTAIDKWNGILPQVAGDVTPFLNLDTQKLLQSVR